MKKVSLITNPVETGGDGSFKPQAIRLNNQWDIVRSGHRICQEDKGISTQCSDYSTYEYIQIKKSGDLIIFMPMLEDYRAYIKDYYYSESVWYMPKQVYEQLRAINTAFPPIEKIKQLNKRDCVEIFYYELPDPLAGFRRMYSLPDPLADFGMYSLIDLNELYLNTDAPEGKKIIKLLQRMLADWQDSDEPVNIKPLNKENEVTIILDTPDYYEWKPLCKVGDCYYLCLDPGYKVEAL